MSTRVERVTKPRAGFGPRVRARTLEPALVVALSLVFGAVVANVRLSIGTVLLVLALAAFPALVIAVERRPVLIAALFVAAQPLDAFQIPTPLGHLSVGSLTLLALLAFTLPRLMAKLRVQRELSIGALLLGAWLAYFVPSHMFYLGLSASAREAITATSFVMVAAVAASLPTTVRTLQLLARGALFALGALAVLGIAASEDWIQHPQRFTPARTFFGFTSPFIRNYGLDLPWDSVAFLAPVALGYYTIVAIRGNSRRAWVAYAVVFLAVIFVFQSREMLLQCVLALSIGALLVRRHSAPFVLPITAAGVAYVYAKLSALDAVSTQLRGANDLQIIRTLIASPSQYLVGTNENVLYAQTANVLGYGQRIGDSNAIHNLFLSNLVSGGYVAFVLITAAYVYALQLAWQRWRAEPDGVVSQTLLLAMVLVMFACSVEPVRADIVGSWLVIGLVFARGGRRAAEDDALQIAHRTAA